MKTIKIIIILIGLSCSSIAQQASFYDFVVEDIDGNKFDFSQLKGKKVLIVNTASKCYLTPQYKSLQSLYEDFEEDDFVVLAFPANNFLMQEPSNNKQIRSFSTLKYGVTFPMMSKVSVKGDDTHPLYNWLTSKELNGKMDSQVEWNFQKYMINEQGELIGLIEPVVDPYNETILDWLTEKK